jgi:dUTP pyrophosphatase
MKYPLYITFASDDLDESYLPKRGSLEAAGFDLQSCEDIIIEPKSRKLVSTGLIMSIQDGFYGHICPRSGLAVKGIDIGAGIIDSDYRGIVKVLLINNSDSEFKVERKMRIAQLLIKEYDAPQIIYCKNIEELRNTSRGEGGFGSTGLK